MSNKHAPGPWTMTVYPPDDDGAEDPCAYIDDGNGKHVAHCLPLSKNNNQVREANARLISAAPELLEALQAFVKYADDVNDDSPEFDRASAAIAKAIGGRA